MKGGVTRGLLTKDVRSADGWQIGMDVFDQYVQVRCDRSSARPNLFPSIPPSIGVVHVIIYGWVRICVRVHTCFSPWCIVLILSVTLRVVVLWCSLTLVFVR